MGQPFLGLINDGIGVLCCQLRYGHSLAVLCAVLLAALRPLVGGSVRFVAVTVLFCFADGGVAPATATAKLEAVPSSETSVNF